ncbi:MAG: UDP-N-acetylglucosamine 1-carboxyvinyltransferase [Pirellulales bacterium]|nr:UDP-N-acetylglucosamine 1-carboxyvinyltransferase [Pirellulales bacterium]
MAQPSNASSQVLRIAGGRALAGRVAVGGAKNAALPIMAATLLTDEPVRLSGVPHLADVETLAQLLRQLGVAVERDEQDTLCLATVDDEPVVAPYTLVERMRASFCVLGPLVARRGGAVVSLPGGCMIGDRPVDLHLAGLQALGAEIQIDRGYVIARARRLCGARVHMAGRRGPTVTGTANILCAATLARGTSTITGAAVEPEIVDLGNFLRAMGARIDGLGTPTIRVEGVERLGGVSHTVIPDRIEAATLLIAGAMTGGEVELTGARPAHLRRVLAVLEQAGARLVIERERIALAAPARLRALRVAAEPYPGVPTDVQALLTAMLLTARGHGRIIDRVFADRFLHVDEFRRLGADIVRRGATASIEGVRRLSGATVTACDLRAAAALALAGLVAEGETIVRRIDHLDRGYDRLEDKLAALGARIERIVEPPVPTTAWRPDTTRRHAA